MNLTRILAFPPVVAAIIFLYLSWEVDALYSTWVIPPVVLLALLYVFHNQIDWWYFQKNPPKLAGPIRNMLETYHPFYRSLNSVEKTRFRRRMGLFIFYKEFKGMGIDSVPEDLQAIVAANAVQLTFNREDFLLKKYDTVVLYPHPFPSPAIKKLHASEIEDEDGVFIYSAEQLLPGTLQPAGYFNIGLYEMTKAFVRLHPQKVFPEIKEEIWPVLKSIGNFSDQQILELTGEEKVDRLAASVVFYFSNPSSFRQHLPGLYREIGSMLK